MKALSKSIAMGLMSMSIVACSVNKKDELAETNSIDSQTSESIFKAPTQPAVESAKEALDGLAGVEQQMTEAEKLEADRKERELALKEQKQAAEIAATAEANAVEDRKNQAQARADSIKTLLQYGYLGQQTKMMGEIMNEDTPEQMGVLEYDYAEAMKKEKDCLEANTAAGTSSSSSDFMKIFRDAEEAGLIPADPYAKTEEDAEKESTSEQSSATTITSELPEGTLAGEQSGGRFMQDGITSDIHANAGTSANPNAGFDVQGFIEQGKKLLRNHAPNAVGTIGEKS